MTYTEQHVQMARQVVAVAGRDRRCSVLVDRLAERTGLTPLQCLSEIHEIAVLPHPLDATAGTMWAEAFRAA